MSKLAVQDYGLVRERSEGTLYLMRKLRKPIGWAEEVAVRIDGRWVVQDGSKYRVLWGDVSRFSTKEEKSRLLEILKEAGLTN